MRCGPPPPEYPGCARKLRDHRADSGCAPYRGLNVSHEESSQFVDYTIGLLVCAVVPAIAMQRCNDASDEV